MLVLGIESSCDETGVALYDAQRGLLANQIYSQVKLHADYGGVVPELASRDHVCKMTPLLRQALHQAELPLTAVKAVAYTAGPGLIGALLVGASFAKSLAFSLQIPALAIHHMEAHLFATMLEAERASYPFLALLVSGGHSLLMLVREFGHYELLGETLDDAVGEAFDKTAKLLGLPYPGGPALAELAQAGDPQRYHFPRPMTDRPGLDFSFSGLKTYAMNTWRDSLKDQQTKSDIAAAFQQAVVATLLIKIRRALKQTGVKQLVVAGGVSANAELRRVLLALDQELAIRVLFPRHEFCSDNAAMVAFLGSERLVRGHRDQDLAILVKPRWPLVESLC